MESNSLNRGGVVEAEKIFQMRNDYESMRKRYSNLMDTHSTTMNTLELAQEESRRLKTELDKTKTQCNSTLIQWDRTMKDLNDYKVAYDKLKQQNDEAMKEINRSYKASKDIKRLTEERDAAIKEYSLIMSERDSVHRDIEKLQEDLTQSKKHIKNLEEQNKELLDKVQVAAKEMDVFKGTREWAITERDKYMREKESLRTFNENLRRERDSANSKLAKVKSESEEIKRQYNAAVKQLKEMKEKMEAEKEIENHHSVRLQYLSASSSFSESRDSAIDSDMPSGHYSINLPNVRGSDHGLVLEPGVYISRIVPGSPAAKESSLNIGDRVLFINENAIENVQDAILALSEDVDPIMLTLSRSAGNLVPMTRSSSIGANVSVNGPGTSNNTNSSSPAAASPGSGAGHGHGRDRGWMNSKLLTLSNSRTLSAQPSTSSLKSDKSVSDVNSSSNNVDNSNSSSNNNRQRRLRNIFNVKLPRSSGNSNKKVSSAEEEILETLNSAIASGGSGSTGRKTKKGRKRASSRGAGSTSASAVDKNGTWPRVMLNRNSACSYTLPHDDLVGVNSGTGENNHSSGASGGHYASLIGAEHRGQLYGNTLGAICRPNTTPGSTSMNITSTKERIPLSALVWDFNSHPPSSTANTNNNNTNAGTSSSKSVGNVAVSIHSPSGGTFQPLLHSNSRDFDGPGDFKGTSTLGRNGGRPGYIDSITGLNVHPGIGQGMVPRDSHSLPQHHRYSFGVFDPSSHHSTSSGRKADPQRNSVVPTLSDGSSSLDFSVKSGNMDANIWHFYSKYNNNNKTSSSGKINPHNSSESDHLDKMVVTPPSILGLPTHHSGNNNNFMMSHSGSSSNVYSAPVGMGLSMGLSNTLNRFSTHLPSRYSTGHSHHNNPIMLSSGSVGGSGSQTLNTSAATPGNNQHYFEPQLHHSHHTKSQSQSSELSGAGGGIRSASTTPLSSALSLQKYGQYGGILNHPMDPMQLQLHHTAGTLPRTNREPHNSQRIRIPSNQSSVGSTSMDKFDFVHSSPIMPPPNYHVEHLSSGDNGRNTSEFHGHNNFGNSGSTTSTRSWKPEEIREIQIEKSSRQLGIRIEEKPKIGGGGGIFISQVTEGSAAHQAGLRVGYQILEVYGINMRSANYNHASQILSQSTDIVTLLVQAWPMEKYNSHSIPRNRNNGEDEDDSSDGEFHSDGSSADGDDNNSSLSENEDSNGHSSGRSDSLTPCNSPQSTLVRNSKKSQSASSKGNNNNSASFKAKQGVTVQLQQAMGNVSLQDGSQQCQSGASTHTTPSGTLTRKSAMMKGDNDQIQESTKNSALRYLTLSLMKNSSNLGISLVGGNVVGIFVHSVIPDSIADRHGLRTGDQILEYNGTNLREATAEEAAFELAKPLDKVNICVQYNVQRYNEIKDHPGDGFYIRALFEYPASQSNPGDVLLMGSGGSSGGSLDSRALSFHKDEILYVDNTMYNGMPGKWRAWKVDSEGRQKTWGTIPAKFKIEEDLLFKRSAGDLENSRSSTVARRSFFRRKSHHTSRELASFSDYSINAAYAAAGDPSLQLKAEEALMNPTYQRVARLDCLNLKAFRKGLIDNIFLRPVIILGALSDLIADRLVQDFPYQFGKVQPEIMHCPGAILEQGLTEGIFIDYKRKSAHYECITRSGIEEISSKKLYCILDLSTSGIERLQRAKLYPIVLMVKFKSPKQIRELKKQLPKAEIKELYEHSLKVENEYKHLITANYNAGANMSLLVTQIKTAVEQEQSKTLWVPV